MSTAEKLLAEIESFCERHGMSETAFGRKVANDNHMVRRIREKQSLTTTRLDRIRDFMREYDELQMGQQQNSKLEAHTAA